MSYKRMRRVSAVGEQLSAAGLGVGRLTWLLTRPSIDWTSWVLAAIVFPMSAYFAWPRRNRQRCRGCGTVTHTTEPL